MKQDELFQLGKIVRTFGSKGELIFQVDTEIFSQIKKLESVFLKINENLVPFFIEIIQPKSKGQVLVKFLDVNDADDALQLAGCAAFIPRNLLPKPKRAQLDSYDIDGFSVVDATHGLIGTVSHVLDLPQQSLLAIDFNGKEILVPVVEEIITQVDRKKKTIHIEAPEGLIELYL